MADQDKDQLTEEATPRRKEQSREKGEVARSRDVGAAAAIAGGLGAMWMAWSFIAAGIVTTTSGILGRLDADGGAQMAGSAALRTLVGTLAPVAVTIMVLGVAAEVAQVGWKPTAKTLVPDFSKMNPLNRIKGLLFSSSTAIELTKALVKIAVVGVVSVMILRSELDGSGRLVGLATSDIMIRLGGLLARLAMGVGAVIVVMAVADVLIERYRHRVKLRMSKQQVKDEYKEMEGDPAVRAKLRGRQREAARRRMMAALETADVVVTNPTHYAVGLRYRMGTDAAPIIVAMGADDTAAKIRDRARRFGIPIASNPPLARGLFAKGKLGGYIPTEFYKAVAALLAWVYRIGGKVR
jgi:flagellar biosynthetic protein FlhB